MVGESRAGVDELLFHFFVGKSTVAADEFKEATDRFFGFCDGGREHFVVVSDVFEKFPVSDEAFAVFPDQLGFGGELYNGFRAAGFRRGGHDGFGGEREWGSGEAFDLGGGGVGGWGGLF
ncbi:MAG: hypothetical protein ACJAXZ_004611 [Akkermansiaceae bacterium]